MFISKRNSLYHSVCPSHTLIVANYMQKNSKTNTGSIGEDIACEYLIKKKYNVLARNYRQKWGEIDIVCRETNGTLVFVEVKTLTNNVYQNDGLIPEDHATRMKLDKVKRTAELFVNAHPELIDEKRGWQVDLIAIKLDTDGRPEIKHYENV